MNLVTRGLGAKGVIPTAGLGYDGFGIVVAVQPAGWITQFDLEKRRDDDMELIMVIVSFLNSV